jgi:hypothetical protein
MMHPSDPDLVATLLALAQVMERASDDWWIIGSAAVALHLCDKDLGGDPGQIGDVDVIVSRRDLDALYAALPLTNTPETGKPMFVSERFGRWSEPPLDVEFMAGLKLRVGDDWQAVQPQTRKAIMLGEHALHVPERGELIAILHSFGREKDRRRAATLK